MTEPKGRLVYLASPYTHPDPKIEETRFHQAADACGWLFSNCKGYFFLSPISHTHPISIRCRLPGEWQYWASYDECLISRCDELWILCIDGFLESTGVSAEKKIAEKTGLPIKYVVPAVGSFTVLDSWAGHDKNLGVFIDKDGKLWRG